MAIKSGKVSGTFFVTNSHIHSSASRAMTFGFLMVPFIQSNNKHYNHFKQNF